MLAASAPSHAGTPSSKPTMVEATMATPTTPTPALRPLTICCPTASGTKLGERQPNIGAPFASGSRGALQCVDRICRGRVEARVATLGECNDLANHFRRPEAAQMRRDAV